MFNFFTINMDNPFLIGFLISVLGLFLLLINTLLFVYLKKNIATNITFNLLVVFLISYFIIEFICNILGFLKPASNIFVSHFAFNIQFLLLSAFFYKLFNQNGIKKMVIVAYVIYIIINGLLYFLRPQLFWEFNLFEISYISFAIIGYTLIHIYNNLGENKKYFYFTIGLSTYMLSSSLIFLTGNIELVFYENPYIDIWVFNSLFFIVYQILIFKEWRYIRQVNANNN
ncbi:hypothetical protein C7H52_06535 [Aurantibacter aestuarii]|uniref:Uncharacterized protein n=1 Tax=Aurantibacter aestuarii TaxID=1266046 RepID=A0A2T1NBA3_9FLAO|nr:hypothetical protein C7H52_06535 [Aurantibacter aestuarii]